MTQIYSDWADSSWFIISSSNSPIILSSICQYLNRGTLKNISCGACSGALITSDGSHIIIVIVHINIPRLCIIELITQSLQTGNDSWCISRRRVFASKFLRSTKIFIYIFIYFVFIASTIINDRAVCYFARNQLKIFKLVFFNLISCLVLTCLFFIAGCKKEPKEEPTPEPIEVCYYEFFGPVEPGLWINLSYDEKVIIINNEEKLKTFLNSGINIWCWFF